MLNSIISDMVEMILAGIFIILKRKKCDRTLLGAYSICPLCVTVWGQIQQTRVWKCVVCVLLKSTGPKMAIVEEVNSWRNG